MKTQKRSWEETVPKHEIYEIIEKETPFTVDADSQNFLDLAKTIVSDADDYRPIFGGINFDAENKKAEFTDSHIAFLFPYDRNFSGVISPSKFNISEDNPNAKFPNILNVIRETSQFTYECNLIKLKTYCEILIRLQLLNLTTYGGYFYFDENKAYGLNVRLLLEVIKVYLKSGYENIFVHIEDNTKAIIFSTKGKVPHKSKGTVNDIIALLMPMFLDEDNTSHKNPMTVFQNYDGFPFEEYSFGWSFEKNNIVGPEFEVIDLQIAKKPKTALQAGLDINLIKKLKSVFKLKKSKLRVGQFIEIKSKKLIITDLGSYLEINDIDLPDGFYDIRGNTLVQMKLNKDDEYPEVPKISGNKVPLVSIDLSEFTYHFDKAIKHVGKDELRPIMMGIVLSDKYVSGLEICSTDAHSMYRQKFTRIGKKADKIGEVIIPYPSVISSLSKYLNCGYIDIYKDDRYISLECDDFKFTIMAESGMYPNFNAVWNIDKADNQFSIDPKELQSIIKEAKKTIKANKLEGYELRNDFFALGFKEKMVVLYGTKDSGRRGKEESKALQFWELKKFDKVYSYIDTEFKNKNTDDFERIMMPTFRDGFPDGNFFNLDFSKVEKGFSDHNSKEITIRYGEPKQAIFIDGYNDWKEKVPKKASPKKESPKKPAPKDKNEIRAVVGSNPRFFKSYNQLSAKGKQYQDAINSLMDMIETFESGDKQIDIYAQAIVGLNQMRDVIEQDDLPF